MLNDTLMQLFEAYRNQFTDIFPSMCFPNDSNEELANKIQLCLSRNQPAETLFALESDTGIRY